MSKTIYKVKLTENEISDLESILRQPASEARHYIRAKILLLKHKNYSSDQIACNLDIAPSTVKLCVKRYAEGGIEAALNDRIRLILDNHSAHTSQETQKYLNEVPGRFEFVFTPTHGSWLNMVEGVFQ